MKHLVILFFSLYLATAAFAQGASHSVALNYSWTVSTGDPATGFHCQRSATTGGPYTTVLTVPVTSLSCTDNTVVGGQTAFYVVTAFNAAGDSGPTNEFKAVVPIAVPNAPATLTGIVH